MLALLQRVTYAKVHIANKCTASIEAGLLIFCGFQPHDTSQSTLALMNKCLNYRLFSDQDKKMNLSVKTMNLELLLVPQFTLAADTKRGLRASFSKAASPEESQLLFTELSKSSIELYPKIHFGQFREDMKISLCNDGPVTFLLSN
jgi:D-tyrosyl-tRNA(Tyr) deacylase